MLRAEGVNFAATLFDTNDISTVRGASLALSVLNAGVARGLAAAGVGGVREEFAGASQCLFSFDLPAGGPGPVEDRVRAALAEPDPEGRPFPHLSVMVDAVALEAGADALRHGERVLEARNRARQMRAFSVPAVPFAKVRRSPDPLEGIQPGTVRALLPGRRVLDAGEAGDGAESVFLAPSVAARRRYGRTMRRAFYRTELGDDEPPVRVTESLQDIVADPPRGLPPSVAGKIAVVYADGNRFGDVRAAIGARAFSEALTPYRRDLLRRIVTWMQSAPGDPAFSVWDEGDRPALRLETLLYGGDEFTVVLPAWLAASFVEGFFAHTAGWTVNGARLTHAVGVAVANAKAPIRQLTAIAEGAADAAKEAGLRDADSVTFEIFESLAPPDTALANLRASQYGAHADGDALARRIALPGGAFGAARATLARLRGEDGSDGFPRSQIYAALRAVRRRGCGFLSPEADAAVTESFDRYAARAGAERSVGADEVVLPAFGSRGRALDLALLASLWDYADPLAGTGAAELADIRA